MSSFLMKAISELFGRYSKFIYIIGSLIILGMYGHNWAVKAYEQPFVEFAKVNSYKSTPLNSPVKSGDRLQIRWSWSKAQPVAYCYFYHIQGVDFNYLREVPGPCNNKKFAKFGANKEDFYFDSVIGVQLPYNIPPGKYQVVYHHLPQDWWNKLWNKEYKFKPIQFEVK